MPPMKPRGSVSRRLCVGIVAITSALVLASCGSGSSSSSKDSSASSEGLPATIPISVIVPTTGPLGTFGQQVVAGAKAATAQIEESGDLGSSKIELSVEDTGSSPTTAASLTQSTVRKGVVAIIGSPISNEALASAPIANSAKVPYLATTAPGPQLPEIGEYVYSMSTPQPVQLRSYVKDLVKSAPKVTVIYASDNDTTVSNNETIKSALREAGGTLVQSVSTTLTATNNRVVATKAMEGSPDAIGVLSGGAQLPALVTELRALGYKGRIFANGGADVSAPGAGEAVNGLEFQGEWAPNIDTPLSKTFAKYVAATSPGVTPHYPAVDGYNSLRFIVQALLKANSTDGEKLIAAMREVAAGGFESPGGAVTFTGTGNRQLESPVYNLTIHDGVVSVQN